MRISYGLAVYCFLTIGMVPVRPLLAAEAVSGVIEKIRSYDQNHYEIKVRVGDGSVSYLVSSATDIRIEVPARKVQLGHQILLTGELAQKKIQALMRPADPDGPRTPMPEEAAEALQGQPQPGQAPEVPELPEDVKDAKEDVLDRDPPNEPSPEEAGQAPPEEGGKKAEDPEEAEIPTGLGFTVPEPEVLSAATAEDPEKDVITDTVVKKEETAQGVLIQFAQIQGESLVLPFDEALIRIGGLEDLEQQMRIRVEETGDNNFIKRMTVELEQQAAVEGRPVIL